MHFWSMNLRSQLEQGGAQNIRVIEIAPPTVSTDLHRERKDPSDNKKDKNASALGVDEFLDQIVEGWKNEKDTIGAGPSSAVVERWFNEFGPDYKKAAGH